MSRDTLRLLAALVLRALGATLLMATVLLPAADHHALARLSPDVLASSVDPHDLLVHHHWRYQRRAVSGTASTSLQGARAVPTVGTQALVIAPAAPAYEAAFGGPPVMAAVGLGPAAASVAWLLRGVRQGVPPSRALSVSSPPPRPAPRVA
jgi:hypothetical protein